MVKGFSCAERKDSQFQDRNLSKQPATGHRRNYREIVRVE